MNQQGSEIVGGGLEASRILFSDRLMHTDSPVPAATTKARKKNAASEEAIRAQQQKVKDCIPIHGLQPGKGSLRFAQHEGMVLAVRNAAMYILKMKSGSPELEEFVQAVMAGWRAQLASDLSTAAPNTRNRLSLIPDLDAKIKLREAFLRDLQNLVCPSFDISTSRRSRANSQ